MEGLLSINLENKYSTMNNFYSIQKSTSKENFCVCISFLILSVSFLLIHSGSTSPLYLYSDFDSNAFMLLGKYFNLGKDPMFVIG